MCPMTLAGLAMKNRRTRKLIDPRIQLNLLAIVFAATGVGIALQAGLTSIRLDQLAREMQHDGMRLEEAKLDVLSWSALHALGFAIPLVGLLAFTARFRIAGPLYRFRQFLGAVLRGEHPEPCRLRRHDEFQDLCELLNDVTAEARERQRPPAPAPIPATPSPEAPTEVQPLLKREDPVEERTH